MRIKKGQAILKCFIDLKSSVWFTLGSEDETISSVTLRTLFSSTAGQGFHTLNDEQSYILRKISQMEKNPAKPNYHMSIKKSQAKFTEKYYVGLPVMFSTPWPAVELKKVLSVT